LEQILLRLPVKSPMGFKSACKSWCNTIASPRFEQCHLQLSKARQPSMLVLPFLVVTHPLRMERIMFFGYPGYGAEAELVHEKSWSTGIDCFRRPTHCNGLVMVAAGHSSQISVCKTNSNGRRKKHFALSLYSNFTLPTVLLH
ncbi:hypothetical protein BAE44_0025762, partial [Dichanthelium oligosanthes]